MAAFISREMSNLLVILFLLIKCIHLSQCKRVIDVMYEDLKGDMSCFKRFNGTHEVGCTSKQGGNVGAIQLIDSSGSGSTGTDTIDWLINSGQNYPYILVVEPKYLTVEVLTKVQNSNGKINGVIVLWDERKDVTPDSFSGQAVCPNDLLSLYKDKESHKNFCEKTPWNPSGDNMLFRNYDFPIFLLTDTTSIDNLTDCYWAHNDPADQESYPLCAVQLKSAMFGTTNSEVCLRRTRNAGVFNPTNFCDPLHDYNVWGSLKPMNATEGVSNDSVIIIAARGDSASLFNNISPGANSAVSGLVTLLLIADAINRVKEELLLSANNINVLFVLFEGETWDYIGSSRMVYDMNNNQFPFKEVSNTDQMAQLSLDNILHFIEISQVGKSGTDQKSQLYIHSDPISNSNEEIKRRTEKLIQMLRESSEKNPDISYSLADEKDELPPSSFQTFLKYRNISGIVIADHKTQYKNSYYDSIFDDYMNLGYISTINSTDETDPVHIRLSNTASTISNMVINLLTEDRQIITKADEVLANDLLHCYLRNVNCSLFRDHITGVNKYKYYFEQRPAKMYASVYEGEDMLTHITMRIFAYLLGDVDNVTESECKSNSTQIYQHYYFPYINNGTCMLTTVRESPAYSPAFIIDDYDWSSGQYSTWTESGWALIAAKLFLIPSPSQEIGLVVSGVIVVILSFIVTYLINRRADQIFNQSTIPTDC